MSILKAILALAAASLPRLAAAAFDLTGQVFSVSGGTTRQLFLYDASGPGQSRTHVVWDCSSTPARVGDIVRARGETDDTRLPRHVAREIRILRHEPLPDTRPLRTAGLFRPDFGHHPVRIAGVVMAAVRDNLDSQWNWLVLNTPAGRVCAAAAENEYPLASLWRLVDRDVVLHGITGTFSAWRNFLGNNLHLYGRDGVRAAGRPAPGNLHRQPFAGTVAGRGKALAFLDTGSGDLLPAHLAPGTDMPALGSPVTARGFVVRGQKGPELIETILRTNAPPCATRAAATPVSAQQLFSDDSGHDLANSTYFGRLIRVRGHVETSAEALRANGLLSLVVDEGHRLSVDVSQFLSALPPDFGLGYVIDASGICYAAFDTSPTCAFPAFTGFMLYPRDAADIAFVRRPPWWTPFRLTVLVALLLALIAGVLVWNRAIRHLAERRGRELARERLRLAKSEFKVEERTRLAVELHDSISQTLTGVALQVETALGLSRDSAAPSVRFLKAARQMLASCRQELRCCLWDLRSRTFEEKDLTEAIRRAIQPHAEDARLAVRFNVPRGRVSEPTVHAILKIVRELVVNAIRHGHATHVRVAGERTGDLIRFAVTDDGRGFDAARAPGPAQGHFGLQGVRERAAERDGTVTVTSCPGGGTRVLITLTDPHA